MDILKIGNKIMLKRKEFGIKQEDLAEFIGVTKASVSKWESGQSYPDITFLPQLASFFNISVDELISYDAQLSNNTVEVIYKKFCREINKDNFDELFEEVTSMAKKYYSSSNLLYYLGLFLINHAQLNNDKYLEIIGYAREIITRAKSNSKDEELCKNSKRAEALCSLLLNEPKKIIDLLYVENQDICDDTVLIANAFEMLGKTDKAEEILQIGLYQNLISIVEKATTLIMTTIKSKDKAIQTYSRLLKIVDIFDIKSLHPSILFNVYLIGSTMFLSYNEDDNAMIELEKYVEIVQKIKGQFTLHGDNFFDKIDNYINSLVLGKDTPRSAEHIMFDIVNVIESNQFDRLKSRKDYKDLILKLKEI